MTTPLKFTLRKRWVNEDNFELRFRPFLENDDSKFFESLEYINSGLIVPVGVDYDQELYPNNFLTLGEALEKWTVNDSDIPQNSEFIKYFIEVFINQPFSTDYVLGEITLIDDPETYYALQEKVDKVTGKGLSTEDYSSSEKTKLSGIASGSTANDTDANLKARANHTGTQTASTISDFDSSADARITAQKGAASGLCPLDSGSKIDSAYLPSSVMEYKGAWNVSTNSPSLTDGTGNNGDVYRASAAATRNLGSGNQTWAIGDLVIYNGTIWEHSPAADGVSSVFTRTGAVTAQSGDYNTSQVTENTNLYYTDARAKAVGGKSVVATTVKSGSFPIFKEATVSSGTAVFHLTADGTSGGTALFTNVYTESVITGVSDATASYQMSWAFTNSNKTLTVTANKLTTSNILTGILGQTQANGSVVKLTVWGE